MNKSARVKLYTLAICALSAALWLRATPSEPAAIATSVVAAVSRPKLAAPAAPSLLAERSAEPMPSELFTAPAAPPLSAPAPPAPVLPPPPAEVRILGWMLSDAVPYVFVEWEKENYTLQPEQSVGDLYRFDRISEGSAQFTFLPDGTTRQYPVSDVTMSE
ncbi:hypothetical protein [Pseudoxanthomonas sp. UTMC 1351]|uniref:hypothetical protein n=1 Tax=Pseudoxanthomonas sp. UTMC 1351 TaxID=2695853 RepID=UPI0034CD2C8C